MINNMQFKIIAGKISNCPKNARLHNKTTRSRPGRGQMFEIEVEAEAKASRPRPRPNLWGRGWDQLASRPLWPSSRPLLASHFGLKDLTSLR